jgi:hypothetical protein
MKPELEVDGSNFLGCPEIPDPVCRRSPAVQLWNGVVASDLTTFPWHLGAVRRSVAVERIERLTLARAAASAAALRSAAESPGTLPVNGDLGHLEGDVVAVADHLAPILISFSFKLVSDQSVIGSGVASVRRKLPRL